MPVIIMAEPSSIVVDPGPYRKTLDKVELVPSKFGGQSLKWHWKGLHDDHGEITLTMITTAKLTPSTKAGNICRVLNGGVPVKVGESTDLEQFIGCVCEVLVENRTADDGVTYSNVVEVIKLIDDSGSFAAAKREEEPTDDVPF